MPLSGPPNDKGVFGREMHFACMEAECRESLIAFNTAEELNDHLAEHHGIQPAGRRGTRTLHPQFLGMGSRNRTAPSQAHTQRRGFAGNELQRR